MDFKRHTNTKEAIGIGIRNPPRDFYTRLHAAEWIHENIQAFYPGMKFTSYNNVKYLPTDISIDLTNYIREKITIRGKNWDELKLFAKNASIPISQIDKETRAFKWSPNKIINYIEDLENGKVSIF